MERKNNYEKIEINNLIGKNFNTLQALHEASIALFFGPSASFLPALADYLCKKFKKEDVNQLTEKELKQYLSEHYIKNSFYSEINIFTTLKDEERLPYILNKTRKDKLLQLAEDISVASSSLKILDGLNCAIKKWHQKIRTMSPYCENSIESNAIGGFFTNLSAGLSIGYAILNLNINKDARHNIIVYNLLKRSVDTHSDPLLNEISNLSQLEEIKIRMQEWDNASLFQYNQNTAEIVNHFWRNGYLPYYNRLNLYQFHKGVLVDNFHRPVIIPDQAKFTISS